MGYVIADYNRKGGIGKTNSLINIVAQLSMNGKKVLAIDGDKELSTADSFSVKLAWLA